MNLNQIQLEELNIYDFESIDGVFLGGNLFLGNGFSINLCERLSYKSLFAKFIEFLEPKQKEIFKGFNTTNFELIIQNLNNAAFVNNLLGISDEDKIEPIVEYLRNGLINSIKENHPTNEEIYYPQLRKIGEELSSFGDIYTTNYDVYLYKIIIEVISEFKDRREEPPYIDYFYEDINPTALGFNNKLIYNNPKSIYYLHGSLFIFYQDNKSNVNKLRKLDTALVEYLSLIKREIENSNFPLFVAEGNAKDKLRTVFNNRYLSFCYSNLMNSKKNMVFYGFSFGDSDMHIVEAINTSEIKEMAISIYLGNKNYEEVKDEKSRINSIFKGKTIVFYNSTSLFKELRPY
jgi:hypothetical protein